MGTRSISSEHRQICLISNYYLITHFNSRDHVHMLTRFEVINSVQTQYTFHFTISVVLVIISCQ